MSISHNIVFLDRASLDTTIRKPTFTHRWEEFSNTEVPDIVSRTVEATIIITNKVPLRAATLAQLPNLKMIAIAATGTDVIDLNMCAERGILVSNVRNYALAAVPEHAFALMLALRRNLSAYTEAIRKGRWQASEQFCLRDHQIIDLAGSRLGIIGYGALGQAVAKLGAAFAMEICTLNTASASNEGVSLISFSELLRTSDVVTLHLPLTVRARHMIGHDELKQMKRSALLINTARGGLVDEGALASALKDGLIAGAGFDVLETEPPRDGHPLLALNQPNFILTPHVAWASKQAMQSLADQLIDNIEAFVQGTSRRIVV